MYPIIGLLLFAMSACKSTEETVQAPPPVPKSTERIVDDNFIVLNDAFNLQQGMLYNDVKRILKQDPYRVYSNVDDNCIILKYKGKRQLRKHYSENEVPVPLTFYPSSSSKNVTYGDPFEMFVILDGEDKRVRSYFMNVNVSKSMEATNMLKRSKLICNNPDDIRSLVIDWFYKE